MLIRRYVLAASIALGCFAAAFAGEEKVHDAALVGAGWKYDAMVVGAKDQEDKTMFTSHDIVYLNEGTDGGLTPDIRCAVYRPGYETKDPETGKSMGIEVKRVGTLEITRDVSQHHASGLILNNTDSIEVGDLVKKE